MALKLSSGLRNMLNGLKATIGGAADTGYIYETGAGRLAFVDGGVGVDTITDSSSGFITAGFAPGDVITVAGESATCDGDSAVLTGVAAGTLTMAAGSLSGSEADPPTNTIVMFARGGSLKDILKDGVLRIYSGSQPSDADQAASGTALLEITDSAGAFTAGAFDNALEFEDDPTEGEIEKSSTETWQDTGIAAGTAGWFRFYANPTDAGAASTTLPRIDGTVGTSGADLNMSNTTITVGKTYTVDEFTLTLPEYYGA